MLGKPWVCPYCRQPQPVSLNRSEVLSYKINSNSKHGLTAAKIESTTCLNPACNELEVIVALYTMEQRSNGITKKGILAFHRLMPSSFSTVQPEYIPQPIRNDYYEACAIRDLSPKASATLSRRCLQGMIRDFAGIALRTLDLEIKALRKACDDGQAPKGVDVETIDAIDHIRSIGNIGAHMEKDIGVIVDVDPDEAQQLIDLIEMLFEEWYIARETRRLRHEKLGVVAAEKQQARLGAPQKKLPPPES